jgi:acetylornithine deacetylase/succinyl-diaminopimelate desuccinylase-like protein
MSANPSYELRESIIDWDAAGSEAVRHLKALLAFDTSNPPGNERPAAEYLAHVLAREGIESRIVEGAPGRASLVARLRGTGTAAPLLLNGHLDVVPAEAECWTHPPFAGVEADGCIWGRGAVDMKNMVAMSLMVFLLLRRCKVELDRDVILAAVADEETGCVGSDFLVTEHPELVRAEYVLNEVGGYTLHVAGQRLYPIQVAERGICWFELEAVGKPGHGSIPSEDCATVKLSRALVALAERPLPLHPTPAAQAFIEQLADCLPMPHRTVTRLLTHARLGNALLTLLARTGVPRAAMLAAMLRNTASPNVVRAGSKVNVRPGTATACIDGRVIPGQTLESFLGEIRQVVGEDLRLTVRTFKPGSSFDQAGDGLFEGIRAVLAQHDPGSIPVPYLVPGFTDSSSYGKLGAKCYGFVPTRVGPNLDYASLFHAHDERIPTEGYCWGVRVLFDLVRRFCGRTGPGRGS